MWGLVLVAGFIFNFQPFRVFFFQCLRSTFSSVDVLTVQIPAGCCVGALSCQCYAVCMDLCATESLSLQRAQGHPLLGHSTARSSAALGKRLLHKRQAPLCCPPSAVLPLLQKQPIMGFLWTQAFRKDKLATSTIWTSCVSCNEQKQYPHTP